MATKQEIIEENEALKLQLAELTEKEDVKEIGLGELISVVSLCTYTMSLSTEGYGKGKVFNFKKFGEKKRITYGDLISIMESHSNFLEGGFFYILDKRVIKLHGLEGVYEKLIDVERMNKVFECSDLSVKVYTEANETQRGLIDRMLVNKLANGDNLDLNVVSAISHLSKTDDLIQQAEYLKEGRIEVGKQ